MAQLIVRNLEDDLKARLQARARARGHSMEEEARRILRGALMQPEAAAGDGLGTRIAARFRGLGLQAGAALPELRGEVPQAAEFRADGVGGGGPRRRPSPRPSRRQRR